MSETTPTPDQTPPPEVPQSAKERRSCNWHRVRVYSLSILIMLTMWFCATMLTIQYHPKRIVDQLIAQLPFPATVGKVSWTNRRTLQIDYVRLGGDDVFFYADSVVVTASPFGLWRHHIAKVKVIGGQLFTKPLYDMMDRNPSSNSGGLDWVIGRFEMSRCTIWLNNLVEDTSIPVTLGSRHTITLTGLRLGKPDASPEMNDERTVEIVNVGIPSPFDPLARVFYFPLIKVRFTYSEIWHHQIREIDVVRPTLYLGEDLFWLTEQFKKNHTAAPAQGPSSPWHVGRFEVQYGRLAVNAFGQQVAVLPFFFNTKVDDIRLDQLDQISAKSKVAIQNLTQDYPDYKVRIVNLHGNLYFSWPPSDANANNVVNTISIDQISWNNIPAKKVSATVTFDPNGVYGKLYGTCEGGQLNGNFEFYYSKNFTWNADLFCTKVNCQPIAEKLAGKYIKLTGELDGKLAVQGKTTEILNCSGLLALPNPGSLEIKSMDDLINRIPADMTSLKRDALKLAIGAFQTYPYDSGQLKISYQPTGGSSVLSLEGPRGKRLFEVSLHPYGVADNAPPEH
jgi:hypothetical protein